MKTYKNLLLFSLFFTLLYLPKDANAQMDDSRIGIKGGLNLSTLYTGDIDERDPRIGFHAGLFTEIAVAEYVSLQPELLFSTKGNTYSYDVDGPANIINVEGDAEISLSYIDLPVLAKVTIAEVINLHAGPYLGYLVDANTSLDGDIADEFDEDIDRDHFNKWDAGVALGAGVDLNAVSIGVRYSWGLVEVADSEVAESVLGNSKNAVLQGYVAIGL